MTPKYYEVVPITEKPEKTISVIFLKDGHPLKAIYAIPVEDTINEIWQNKGYTHYLKPLTSLPIDRDTAEKIWEAGNQSAYHSVQPQGPCDFDIEGNKRNKETYLKQFE